MDVTEASLASALEGFTLIGRLLEGRGHVTVEVDDADAFAAALFATLARMAALHGNSDVVEAHVCCEHADADPELAAMAALLPAVPLLQRLGYDARARVIEWYGHRVNDGQPDF